MGEVRLQSSAPSQPIALRLGKYFGVSPGVWMGLQADYDLRMAQRKIGAEVEKRVQQLPPKTRARFERKHRR